MAGLRDGTLLPLQVNKKGGLDLKSEVQTHTNNINALAFAPDGKRLASGGADKQVKLWNVRQGTLEEERVSPLPDAPDEAEAVTAVAFQPDGVWLAIGWDDGTVKLWNPDEGLMYPVGPHPQTRSHKSAVKAVAFSPDGTKLASGGKDHIVQLWHISPCQSLKLLKRI